MNNNWIMLTNPSPTRDDWIFAVRCPRRRKSYQKSILFDPIVSDKNNTLEFILVGTLTERESSDFHHHPTSSGEVLKRAPVSNDATTIFKFTVLSPTMVHSRSLPCRYSLLHAVDAFECTVRFVLLIICCLNGNCSWCNFRL